MLWDTSLAAPSTLWIMGVSLTFTKNLSQRVVFCRTTVRAASSVLDFRYALSLASASKSGGFNSCTRPVSLLRYLTQVIDTDASYSRGLAVAPSTLYSK